MSHQQRRTEMEKTTVEIFIAMNENGDFIMIKEESEALEILALDCGGYHARVVKVTVKMAPPVMTETEVEVPDEAGETTKVEAAA
jgi:hexokinase